MKLLSVAIPVFNAELDLDECLRSLVDQGFTEDELEIILIDDGSFDSSAEIIRRWAREYPNMRSYTQESKGISYSRNLALRLATGKYFAFLDADDIANPGTYRKLVAHLEVTGSDFVTGPVYRFSEHQKKAWAFTRSCDLFDQAEDHLTLAERPEFIRDFMVWNKVFRKSFLDSVNVEFPEGMIYEDVAVMPHLFEAADSFDVVDFPPVSWRMSEGSISRTIQPKKALDRLEILTSLKQHFGHSDNKRLIDELDFAILDYNLRWVFQEFYQYDDETKRTILSVSHSLTHDIDESVICRLPAQLAEWSRLSKTGDNLALVQALEAKPVLANFRVGEHRDVENNARAELAESRREKRLFVALTWRRRIRHAMLYLVFRPLVFLLPLKENYAMFSNYWGRKFSRSDGPASICVELSNLDPTFKLIVVRSRSKEAADIRPTVHELVNPRAKVVVVKNESFSYFYYLWRAKYLFNDVNFNIGFNVDRFVGKRSGQIEVQTTHGTPLKKMGIDSEAAISAEERPKFLAKAKRYDYLVAPSPLVAKTFADSHAVQPQILKTGLPQNDVLVAAAGQNPSSDLKKKYGFDPEKKLIVYAPTYRHGQQSAFRYAIDFERVFEKLGEEYQIAVKIHPFSGTNLSRISFRSLTDWSEAKNKSPFIRLFGTVIEEQNYRPVYFGENDAPADPVVHRVPADINELMLAADVLITDYSSIVFNYPHLDKPLILFVPDADRYSKDRGMYFDLEELSPGPFVRTTTDLIQALEHVSAPGKWREEYGDRIERFKRLYCEWEVGDAAKKILVELGMAG